MVQRKIKDFKANQKCVRLNSCWSNEKSVYLLKPNSYLGRLRDKSHHVT